MKDLDAHGIVALVRNRDGKFLLLEDARELMKGQWAPPHGRCDPGDKTEEQAVVREVLEETGLTVKPIRKVLTQAADTKVKTVSFWLVDSPEGSIRLDGESSDYGWFTVGEALELPLYPGTHTFFELVRTGGVKI